MKRKRGEPDTSAETFVVETPEGKAVVTERGVCIKSSPEVCHRITPEMRDTLLEGAMRLGWKVKKTG